MIGQHPGHAENIRGFRRHWHEMVPYAYEDTVAIMEGLIDAGHDVTMLTNFSDDTFRQAQEELFPFLNRPRGVTVSGRVKLIKPDPRIYELRTRTFEKSRPRGDTVHRRQSRQCAGSQGLWLACGAVYGCREAERGFGPIRRWGRRARTKCQAGKADHHRFSFGRGHRPQKSGRVEPLHQSLAKAGGNAG